MCVEDMSNNPPPSSSRAKDFFPSPALSLSLAGIFRHGGMAAEGEGASTSNMEVEEGEEGSTVGGDQRVEEISSEYSGPTRSKSEDEFEGDEDEEGDGDGDNKHKKKKRKKYHRHTAEQIRIMEALFKESPHPDEKQRQQLSKQLGLAPRQVKFWFQNRRTQIKAIQERHENSLLKTEIEKLREKNKTLRETINKACCPNCGVPTTNKDGAMPSEEQQLRIENAKLKAEVEKLRATLGKQASGTMSPSCSTSHDQENIKSSLDFYTGIFGLDESRIMDIVNQAMDELIKMATMDEPLWLRSLETGREILNYDEYMKEFLVENSDNGRPKRSIEASRDTGVVFADLPRIVQCFLDANQWKEMFPCLISKAATVDIICKGESSNKNGAVQLMFAELQMLTPMVPTREVYFVRYCKQLSGEKWAIVDVSIDKVEDNIDASLVKCRKRPSGCIIEDKSNGHCKVIWVEHLECRKSAVHSMYRTIVNSGLAFGARHWIATLQLQCERLVFFMATNVPMKDSTVSSVWLPISPNVLFDFLRDEARRTEWDIMSSGGTVQSIANLAKGQDRGNAVTIQTIKSKENNMWILQDSCTNSYESMVVYAPVDITGIQSVMTGCDSSNLAILPSGFSIIPDGLESRPMVITSRQQEKNTDGGSLFTVAFQILTNSSPTAKLTMESVDSVNSLVSCTLKHIRTSLNCEDG
ncbi:hypothetical protein TSUD_112810 [Trifolium subterraneum]|uniref:Homeobox domain-containing protein n=1 Tax=Trifolium subterraneum TaxID=3900 RepID=A0A2Z6MCG6_TRISU|nr:hypothetical protein TSUD_112810 [Trifolium subterraneum]